MARWSCQVMMTTVLPRQCWLWHDIAAESYWRWRCRDDLAAVRCLCQVMLAMTLSSHAIDGTAKATWPRRIVSAESYWQSRYRGDLVAA
jgi:hypothetical protein